MSNGNAVNKGAIAELRVGVDLLSKGYHVFRSESPGCPCDIVAIKDGECIKIEVRTVFAKNKRGDIPQSYYSEHLPGFVDWWAFVFPEEIVYIRAENCRSTLPIQLSPDASQAP